MLYVCRNVNETEIQLKINSLSRNKNSENVDKCSPKFKKSNSKNVIP